VAEQASPRVAYRGFISYSHRDAVAGAKLHRRLETYKLPKHLIGTETARGIVPERLTPIFRDREELSAGQSLSQQVQEALAASDVLIILCSPNAKASIWVGKEIETFSALHPERPILAALLEGEPADAFPDALTADGAEPIAADLRKGKDGWRLGQQKLIAGMTGVPLDALVQRDAQRQLRRVTAITVSALIAMLVMSLLLVAALRARSEADRQRTEAEGLVEYMLTDLRDKLKGVGRLDVMTAVNQRAMDHYGKQGDLASLPPESLNRRARILHAMGEDDEKRGDLGLALKKFEEAHRTTAAVMAQKPGDPDAIFAHAQSEYWVGYIAWQKDDRPTTERYWQGYLNQAVALARLEPQSARSELEQGYANGNLCDFHFRNARSSSKAQHYCKVSIKHGEEALRRAPENREITTELANRRGWLAKVYEQAGAPAMARTERELERGLIESLLKGDPRSVELQKRWVWSKTGAATAYLNLGDAKMAAKSAYESLSTISKMEQSAGKSPETLELAMRAKLVLAQAQKQLGVATWRATLRAAETDLNLLSREKAYFWLKPDILKFINSIKQGAINEETKR
jgi:MTH538 TIR-like domain (DUF1863)